MLQSQDEYTENLTEPAKLADSGYFTDSTNLAKSGAPVPVIDSIITSHCAIKVHLTHWSKRWLPVADNLILDRWAVVPNLPRHFTHIFDPGNADLGVGSDIGNFRKKLGGCTGRPPRHEVGNTDLGWFHP